VANARGKCDFHQAKGLPSPDATHQLRRSETELRYRHKRRQDCEEDWCEGIK
jgi:hypothetical protein